MAAALREVGVEEDDGVTIHVPMVPVLPLTMLACARIGAVHSVVFAGFSAHALADRLDDADSEVLVTIDGYYRRGEWLDHKAKADEAIDDERTTVETALLWLRHEELPEGVALSGGDPYILVEDLLAGKSGAHVKAVPREAEDPLFLMYTSGTTGKPKGCQHRTGGYLAYAAGTSKYVLDIEPTDTYWCAADIGWITGHSYIVYGPIALGDTTTLRDPSVPERIRQQVQTDGGEPPRS